nr:MAG TPA: hypothetical protein [Caudoviricetes sp.]
MASSTDDHEPCKQHISCSNTKPLIDSCQALVE